MASYCGCGCGREIVGGRRDRRWATENCRKRFWDECNGRYCQCGEVWLVACELRRNPDAKCRSCEDAGRRWLADRRLELVAGMYNDGWPVREIEETLGYGPTAKAGMLLRGARERGLIGYRYAACAARAAA